MPDPSLALDLVTSPVVGAALPLLDLPASAPRDARPGISGASPQELLTWFADRGEPAFRARQLADHIWSGRAGAFDDIHTLPGALREALGADYRFDTLVGTDRREADGGLTDKALHRLDDGRVVESVLMRYPARGSRRERTTLCISSQAGCAVGCPFCATGELGLWRDLLPSEIIDQARFWRRQLLARRPPTHQHRLHGHGRAAAQRRRRAGRLCRAQRRQPLRPGPAPHRREHERRHPRHRAAHRAAAAVHAGGVTARRSSGAARRAGAPQSALPAPRRGAGGHGVRRGHRPPGHLRDGHDRRHQRHGRRRPGDGGPPARASRACQPHPHEPRRPHALAALAARARGGLRGHPASRRPGHHGAPQPRPRYRRRLRPAGG